MLLTCLQIVVMLTLCHQHSMSGTHCKYFLTFTIGRMHVSVSHKIDCQGPPTTQLTLSHIFLYHILPILPVLGGAITFHGWWKLGIFRFTFEWILQLNLNKLIFLQLHWTVFAILIFEHTHYNICILTIKRNKQRCLISWDLWGIPSKFLVGHVCG